MAEPTISILTTILNSEAQLPRLVESLRKQNDRQFKWVVADGQSTDRSMEILRTTDDLDVTLICEQDCGIYDALNKCIQRIDTDYYLVAGADDVLYPDAISTYKTIAKGSQADIIAAGIHIGNQESIPSTNRDLLGGIWCKTTNHSVGTLIKRSLHDRLGMYSTRYAIASDIAFLLKAYNEGVAFAATDSLVGRFSDTGISRKQIMRSIFETTLIRIEGGYRFETEIVVMLARLLKNYPLIRRGRHT